jgi:hypothetical protein
MPAWSDPGMGSVPWRDGAPADGWRRSGRKAWGANQGELLTQQPVGWSPGSALCTASERAGVRAPTVRVEQHVVQEG